MNEFISARKQDIARIILGTTMPVTKEEIISEIKRIVAENGGKVPGSTVFASATRIKEWDWRGKYWARWADAIKEAGFDPSPWNQKIPDEEVLTKLASFANELGRFPTSDEINLQSGRVSGFPTWTTFKRRYGGMQQTVQAVFEFAKASGNDHLVSICEERLQRESQPALAPRNSKKDGPFGFVYLKYSPSLRLYKIGKAIDPNKLGVGISLLLPHDLVPKHEIRTDCPFLLEKYWEQRFKDKKKQGEWYDLTSGDVETFKSRREFIFREFFP